MQWKFTVRHNGSCAHSQELSTARTVDRVAKLFCLKYTSGAAFTKCFHNSSTIIIQFFPAHKILVRCSKKNPSPNFIFTKYFYNYSTIIPRFEEFGESGLTWRIIVEGIILNELWKHLENAAPDNPKFLSGVPPGVDTL
jgi:hypothetical protein